jgi:pyridoxal phosphate enzyme (YggS family)
MNILNNFQTIQSTVEKLYRQVFRAYPNIASKLLPNILIVTKNHKYDEIRPLIERGHKLFGENKIQEAQTKWSAIKSQYNIKLHFIGALQTNKTKEVLELFDVIESLDREVLADKIASTQKEMKLNKELYIQVNIGDEIQKSGVATKDAQDFIDYCIKDLKLNVTGLMCIPPKGEKPFPYFVKLKLLSDRNKLSNISMGMSGDYVEAIECGATELRIGSAVFGS